MFSNLRTRRSARTISSALLAGGLALGVAACAPATTDLFYAASDGTRVQLESGTLEAVNLMVISGPSGDAQLVGALVNKTNADQTATLVAEDGSINIQVDLSAHKTLNFFTEGTDGAALSNFTAAPGSTLSVQLTDGAGDTAELHVPIMDGSLPEYSEYSK